MASPAAGVHQQTVAAGGGNVAKGSGKLIFLASFGEHDGVRQGDRRRRRGGLSVRIQLKGIHCLVSSASAYRRSGLYSSLPLSAARGNRSQHIRAQTVQTAETTQIAQTVPAATSRIDPPYNVVITGATKGLGLALAKEFLKSGDRVVICSRSAERVEGATRELEALHGRENVKGIQCNVGVPEDVARLAGFAQEQLGEVHMWINNAGSNAYRYGPLIEAEDSALAEIVETNTLGVMLSCRYAIRMMRQQPHGGHIFNMDGAGADGNATPRFAAYGATKRSLAQFTKSLQAELQMLDVKNVVVHNLSPGMVTTELLMSGSNTKTAKLFINALAEPAEEVASYLVPRLRAIPASGSKKSTYIRFLTGPKAFIQIIGRFLFKARKSRYVPED